MIIIGTDLTRDIKRDMADYLPKYYGDVTEAMNIIERESAEFEQLNADIKDVLDQYFIATATWGLSYWERVCNIATDESKPYDQRRSVIKSKLRGMGTVTVEMIKNVADSYTNGDVEVTEDNVNYTVVITFTSVIGLPPNVEDCQSALREIIPAHLGIDFVFRYLTIDEVQAMTINEMQATLLEKFSPFSDI